MDILLQQTLPSKGNNTELIWIYSEKPDIYKKFSQYVPINIITDKDEILEIQEEVVKQTFDNKQDTQDTQECLKTSVKTQDTVRKTKKILPDDIIIKLAETNDIQYVKLKLQEFISQKEFNKVFGVKKCSEIMTAITNNKWNKSLVLFLSFFFDTKFVYLNKEVAYNIEKCSGTSIYI